MEALSQLIDTPIKSDNIMDLRQQVLDKTVSHVRTRYLQQSSSLPLPQIYVQKRHEVMLTDIAKGFLDDSWKWTVAIE